ncbi:porin [Chromobacterium haemolyticum]|uniref:Porin n=1 Tax=Chromobacterium haemolyticum TaxID=394935 RepID=A0ABS3GIM6_9NEIS|nr:porin [Chromobacterium haemolyticum]MBK0413804.1 porin [Chromobacterium haemolyticum]MBO0414906.1 porin [Chromobacterium haemolyticum]MBO0498167.1 porin [Chromobacterium haemolyticum]QOD81114.1 porin [Chromobacterium haemolyticum]BBH13756.1 porin [Chromobacterium haemolyticum]
MPRLPLLPGLAASLFLPVACAEPFLMSRLYGLPQYNGMLKNGGVAMYGSMDLGINYQQAGGHRKWQVQSGGEWTSKIGIFGRELLGNGWKAEFNLEAGFNAGTGEPQLPGVVFNRESWLGLEVPGLGAVRLGRQLAAGLPLFVDVFGAVGTNSAYSWAGMGAVQTPGGLQFNGDLGAGSTQAEPRVGNAIKWISPRWRGFNIDVLHAAAEHSDRPALSNRGMVLSHISGPRYLAASYNQTWQPLRRGGPDNVRNDFYGLGAVYDSGSLVLSSSFKLDLPRRRENGIARVYTLGAIVPSQRHVYRLSVVYRDTSGALNAQRQAMDSSALGLMLGYDYDLSKRSALYLRAGGIRNYGGSTLMLNGQPLPADPAGNPVTGASPIGFSIGMFHNYF